jgi:hypothetical protein
LEEIRSGKSTIDDCVARHPKLAKELRSLLEIAVSIKPDEVMPSEEFKQRAKRRIFQEMQPAPAKVYRSLQSRPKLALGTVIASVLIGLLLLGVAGSSTVYAAQSSLPGDTLYPVKTGVENFRLAVTPSASAKADLRLELAQRRIDEAIQQVKLNRNINLPALETAERQFDEAIKELSNSDSTQATDKALSLLSATTLNQQLELEQVLTSASQTNQPDLKKALDVTRRANIIAQVAYANRDFLKRQPSVADEKIEAGQFNIDGNLLNIVGRTWNVGGVILENVYFSGEAPTVGSRVRLEGLVKGNEVFISSMEVSENSKEPTTVSGQFSGTLESGRTNIGGISVKISDNISAQLKPGDNVQLQGGTESGNLTVTSRESQLREARYTVTLGGVLKAVNATSGIIILKMAGNQITVNVSEARIENEGGRILELSGLDHLIGQNIRLYGIQKRGNLLFARQVRVMVSQ